MVYVRGNGIFVGITAPGDWAYKQTYAYLVDEDGKPVGPRFRRKCVFQLGEVYNGKEYRAWWSEQTVEFDKHSQIDRETGHAECHIF
jgi:hypothetical protein